MVRLKALRIKREVDGSFVVTPLFFAKAGSTRPAPAMAARGIHLRDVVTGVVQELVARGNLSG